MSDNNEKVVFEGMNQPTVIKMKSLDETLKQSVLNSKLYKFSSNKVKKAAIPAMVGDTVNTNSWDTVSVCRVSALNEDIKAKKTYPTDMEYSQSGNLMYTKASFDAWKVVSGGDGQNLHISVPITGGTFIGMKTNAPNECIDFDISGLEVIISLRLNYFLVDEEVSGDSPEDNSYDLKVSKTPDSVTGTVISVIGLKNAEKVFGNDLINQSLFTGAFSAWINIEENLAKFNALFSCVTINNKGTDSDEYRWLRATSIAYAYSDNGSEENSIFGVLCMTNNRSSGGKTCQLPTGITLQDDQSALFIISREVFVRYQFVPGLSATFNVDQSKFIIDKTGTKVNTSSIELDPVKYGAINYHPQLESLEIFFDEACVITKTSINTQISPGIVAHTSIEAEYTFVMDTNEKGEPVMVYQALSEPKVENNTEVATWVKVTEAIVSLIGAVVGFVVGEVVENLILKIVIVILISAVVAIITTIIVEVIIADVVSKGVTDGVPSIAPMIKVAANQVIWPFSAANGFNVADISYTGALVFAGVLTLEENACIIEKKLTYKNVG